MNQYKDNTYYDDYFSNLNDFKLTEPFVIVKDKNKNHYIGKIEACNFVHPLVLRVEIPVTFPHHKLMFYTDSIYGYPHLIPNIANEGKDSWFCLNTPFAETTEGQLDEELNRLRGWITRFNTEQLPARIENEKDRRALNKLVAYIWEDPDELYEYHKKSNVTFIGDFAYKPEFFDEKDSNEGLFHCIKSEGNSFLIVDKYTNCTIPYIIVDEMPDKLDDFVAMTKQFKWSEETCKRLLPDFNSYYKKDTVESGANKNVIILKSEESGKKLTIKEQLDAHFHDPGYTEEEANFFLNKALKKLDVPACHKDLFDSEIESLRKSIEDNHGIEGYKDYNLPLDDETVDDTNIRVAGIEGEIDYYQYVHPYIHNYFMIGIKSEESIFWIKFNTNRSCADYKKTTYDIGIKEITIKSLLSWYLWSDLPNLITDKEFYGRGKFGQNLCDKHVAIIGLGAIGSQLAKSLARNGVRYFGLWDNDIIEPGNICRSTFDINDFGNSKVETITKQIKSVNLYAEVKKAGRWDCYDKRINEPVQYTGGDLYSNINYKSQDDVIKELKDYDLIIDCTANNELLHYLSYAVPDKELVSLCITNQAADLLMVSNADGNAFDLRKFYLSKIEQDTKNFYVEGNGCYLPKFKALNCDVATLVNLAVREINATIGKNQPLHTTTWSYNRRGVVADRMSRYKLKGRDIRLYVSSESLLDAEDIKNAVSEPIGFLLGGYGRDGRDIMITHFVGTSGADSKLHDVYETSGGLIDYIGDMCYASDEEGTFKDDVLPRLRYKANNEEINTNNPLLAVRTPNGNIMFYLYINDEMVPFEKEY